MFAAMCENNDYWKERMNVFVALSPILQGPKLEEYPDKKVSVDKRLEKLFKSKGHEMYAEPFGNSPFLNYIKQSGASAEAAYKLMASNTD